MDFEGGYLRYKLIVDLPDEDAIDPTYDVYIHLENPTVYYTYSEDGLNLYYLVGAETITQTVPGSGDNIVVVEANGTISDIRPDIPEDPEPSDPTDPSNPTDPSEPTSPEDPE
jgi:hypothetical protein